LVLGLGTEDVELQSEVSSFAGARQCHAFSGNAATAESALREFGPAARWIYIANLQHRPKHEVPLAGNRSGNFHLNMSCVYQLQLQPELVALTGFAAGLDSDPIAGEDSFALTRCFLESGAKSVLSTLWNVRGPIMNDFLSRFCGGLNPRLAKAKLFQISQQEIRALYPNPLHWAPFSLSGHVLLD
jgi:CHAT domain-containing protein